MSKAINRRKKIQIEKKHLIEQNYITNTPLFFILGIFSLMVTMIVVGKGGKLDHCCTFNIWDIYNFPFN